MNKELIKKIDNVTEKIKKATSADNKNIQKELGLIILEIKNSAKYFLRIL